ncbi:hypothetical protein EG68_01158 [Paragonimus skrjabini miyazakii]|uniref:Hint domain-containing protein n=1 Tax=Paragonimus skrjabini miyazakii TaxID=59628 RepID=A0A8S9Z7B1_9TREM|nr:hypothetical protein EG68_01158 [Paragonimus skrjabini miyazakii]
MNLFIVLLLITTTHGCLKSSLYYRNKFRSRSHVFVPGEYQPHYWENTVEASGPLESHHFHESVPNMWLVRVESPNIIFDSEEARWMTVGCRDRLLKLSTQIQNTWAKQDVKLRVRRAWTQPPPQPTPQTRQELEGEHKGVDGSLRYPSEADSYSAAQQSWNTQHDFKKLHPSVLTDNSYSDESDPLISSSTGTKKGIHTPIVDMTPEMMVNQPDVPRRKPGRLSSHTALSYQPQRPKHSQWTMWKSSRFPPRFYQPDHHARYRITNTDNSNLHANSWSARTIRHPRDLSINNVSSSNVQTKTKRTSIHKIVGRSVSNSQPFMVNRNYPDVNTMTQLRFQQWLDMRMEEFHYAGRAVDLQLVAANYASAHNSAPNLGILAQMAYYVARFDWCYLSRTGHVHCSVKPDFLVAAQWLGCFPGLAKVHSANGELIPMNTLKVGDIVMTKDATSDALVTTPVVAFIHRDEHSWKPMLQVTVETPDGNHLGQKHLNQSVLYITQNHLVYVIEQEKPFQQVVSKFASALRIGDKVLVAVSLRGPLQKANIVNLRMITERHPSLSGLYAPLTQSGNLVVDGVLVSCFAEFSNELLSNIVMWPLKLYYQLMTFLNHDHLPVAWQGVHWYASWIYDIATSILPTKLFHRQT